MNARDSAGDSLQNDIRQESSQYGGEWLGLLAVVTLHAAALTVLSMGLAQSAPPVTPPRVIGVLVPVISPTPPRPLPPKPLPPKPVQKPVQKLIAQPRAAPVEPVVPVPRPEPAPGPMPIPRAAPSGRAVSALPPPPVVRATDPAPVAAPAPVAPPAPPATVTPPRTDAAQLSNPAPIYPPLSRRMKEQGRVLFDVHILADGSVGEIKLKRSSGYSRLDEAGMEAVRRWRYVPARRGSEAIPYWYVQAIAFSLDG